MKSLNMLALLAATASTAALLATPAAAQKKAEAAPAAAPKPKLSKAETAAIIPLDKAVQAKDWAAAAAALPAAQAAAQGPDAKYLVASRQLQIAQGGNDNAGMIAALDLMIKSGSSLGNPAQLYNMLGSIAYNAKDYDAAASAFERLAQLSPNDPSAGLNVAKIRGMQKQYPQAVAILEQQIAAQKGAGGKASEDTYKLALQYTLDGKLVAPGNKLSRELVAAYPTPENWRLALDIFRNNNPKLDNGATVDLLRLMRAAKLMKGNDYLELAEDTNQLGLPGETKAVLDEGIAAGAIQRARVNDLMTLANGRIAGDRASLAGLKSKAAGAADGKLALGTADAFMSYGDYAEAAALYRTALQKGNVDANVANTRLGIALAMAGNKAEAQTAFQAVSGSRADIAGYWMLWLQQRA